VVIYFQYMAKGKAKSTPKASRRVATSSDIEVSTYLEIAKEISGEQPAAAKEAIPSGEREAVIVIDFGSQYSLLIARRVRECQVYCELVSADTPWEKIAPLNPKGFILSGGPASVYGANAPMAPAYIYESRLPVLGICYGMQVITHQMGGQVAPGTKREYGHALLHLGGAESPLFANVPQSTPVWMSHGDRIETMPPDFNVLAYTDNSPFAAIGNDKDIFGLQFHPEVVHTPEGKTILKNFIYRICGCQGNWTMGNFIQDSLAKIQQQVGGGKVISALSGGVDSSVVATLIYKAIGDQSTCIFVNHGMLRREEVERTFNTFRLNMGMNIVYVDASERFLDRLQGVSDPETKRKIIGEEFINVFEEEAKKIGKVDFLAQGTLYPDVIESASSGSTAAAKIKSHHNVGGLPAQAAGTPALPV
jgi:GMP synthase (glutamine-hydrolysing)